MRRVFGVVCGLVTLGCLLGFSSSAWADTLSVTNTNDSGSGSLRAAVAEANTLSGATIEFSASLDGQTITLTSGPLPISASMTIHGPGAHKLAISGGDVQQLFTISAGNVSISGLTLADGHAAVFGGAINDESLTGSLSVSNSRFIGDTAGGAGGGGTASGNGFGGAIDDASSGALSVSNSTFTGDSAGGAGGSGTGSGSGFGGAINAGSISVSGSTFTGDSAGGAGGGGTGSGTGFGGAIDAGSISVSRSTFSGDSAGGAGGGGTGSGTGFGGAISVDGSISVSGSTFSGDSAGGPGGAGVGSGTGFGGAINARSLSVSDSTLTGDHAGGAGGSGVGSGTGFGGALNTDLASTLKSVTVDGNSVGSAAGSTGSGISGAGFVSATASIVSGNTGAANCDAPVASSSFSLEGPAGSASCGFDLPSADPLLGALRNNGGPTETQALPPSSPAVDRVPVADCPTSSDQRGKPRPDNGESFCDVGAYEFQDVATSTAYTGPTTILAGHQVTLSGRLTDGSSNPISGQTLTLTDDGQSCTATTNTSGYASCTVTATNILGPVTVSASFAGNGAYLASASGPQSAIQFAFPSAGAFVLGDQTAAAAGPATTLTWFGNTWDQHNSLSGDPSSGGSLGYGGATGFDGYAPVVSSLPAATPPASCTGTWTTAVPGGGSLGAGSNPPASVPSYMGVLVASQVTHSGFTFSGNFVHIVVVKTNPGYTGNPQQAGTGTIVASYC